MPRKASKLHLVTDAAGVPLAVEVTAGQTHESTRFEPLIEAVRRRPRVVAGDKAYDLPRIRRWCRRHRIKAVIPEKRKPHGRKPGRPPVLDRPAYRQRNVVERCFGWLKCCRRIATRFEKLATHFLAMAKLAVIQRYLRLIEEPSNRT